jgi:hypothetical protein
MKRDVFLVEMWSDEMRHNAFYGDRSHELDVVHIASSQRGAVEWCKDHLDYGGDSDSEGYFPWHFRIRRRKMNEDGCCVVHNTNEVVDTIYP